MPAGHVVFESDERVRRIGQIVQQNFNSRVRKRFADYSNDPLVILQKLMSVVGNLFTVVFIEQLRVNFLLGRFQLSAHVVLLSDKDELTRSGMIFVLQEVVHSKPKILQAELAKILATDRE